MLDNCVNETTTSDIKSLPVNDGVMRIYALMANSIVVYIGQSVNMKSRIYEHSHSKKTFDSVTFAECDKLCANDVEAVNIVKFQPDMNSELPVNSIFISSTKASKIVIKSMSKAAAFSPSGRRVFYVRASDVDKIIEPQQRIHQVTANKLVTIKESINEEREKIGEKLLTTPDIIEAVVDMFNSQRNNKMGASKL